ncbi:Male sterility NAD-binding [Penicillium paradoxum]|uniref:Male sterility NAD-binding n=1 Tax=Penicillium paradoxum TaxID=176176 RepID=UPI002547A667|nr:Male sterility NAD-binding [Penicillium paradoxum]KAJ5795235.1 Male sterility NAD-binding [Penicillium paradoxum]
MHHAALDGVLIEVLNKMETRYHHGLCNPRRDERIPVPFQYLKHRMDNESEADKFWGQKLGADPAVFPKLPSQNYHPTANEILEYRMTEVPRLQHNGIRLSAAVCGLLGDSSSMLHAFT